MEKIIKYKSILVGTIGIIELIFMSLFFFLKDIIIYNFRQTPGELVLIISLIIVRITIMGAMTIFFFHKWFHQEKRYFTDLTFLIGLFYYFLVIGKSFDIVWILTSNWNYEWISIALLKIRFIIILITMLPILYLGLGILLYSLSFRYDKLTEDFRKRIRLYLVLAYIGFGALFSLLSTSVFTISYIYPFVVLPTLVGITYIFIFAHRNQRLAQVNGLIIGIAFIWYAITSSLRPILTSIGPMKFGLWWLAEILDLGAFIVMFIGYLTKPSYIKTTGYN
jgi:hypothetical protein